MAAIYSNGGNRWNILDFNFTKRDALSSVYKISMSMACCWRSISCIFIHRCFSSSAFALLILALLDATLA